MSDTSETNNPALPQLPARSAAGHKGDFGTVLVVGGCATSGARMIGAPALAATAALRSGAGLVKLACPEPILDEAISLCPSATGVPLAMVGDRFVLHQAAEVLDAALEGAGAIVLGPGLGDEESVEDLVLRLLSQDRAAVVVDADALNALSRIPAAWESVRAPCVLTPHPGEWHRLASALSISGDPTDAGDRRAACEALAQRTGTVVVLKGAGTVVSDGHRSWVCERSCAALATAGTGDVLAGLIGGLVARCVPKPRPELAMLPEAARARVPVDPNRPLDLFDAARVAVDAHAACGQAWSESRSAQGGLLAMELTDLLPTELASREKPAR